jgi:hypothetical protein
MNSHQLNETNKGTGEMLPVSKTLPKKKRKRGQPSTFYARQFKASKFYKSGLWISFGKVHIDRRTRVARSLDLLRRQFIEFCGGIDRVSQAELALVEILTIKLLKLRINLNAILKGETPGSEERFIALTNSIRFDLESLSKGLPERSRGEIPTFEEFMKKEFPEPEKGAVQ